MITNLDVYSSLLLVLATVVYASFTYGILKVNSKMLSVNIAPRFNLSVTRGKNNKHLSVRIENHSEHPANDLDILAIGNFEHNEVPYDKLTSDAGKKRLDRDNFSLFEEDEFKFYGVYKRTIYQTFSGKQSIEVNLTFPTLPDSLYIVFQYRDLAGSNFLHQSWHTDEGNREYYVNFESLPRLRKIRRIDTHELTDTGNVMRKALKGGLRFYHWRRWKFVYWRPLAQSVKAKIYLDKYIRIMLKHSFSSDLQRD